MEKKRQPSKRSRQIADMIQRLLATALRQEIKDPRLSNVTITDVKLSADLKIAKIYYILVKDSELEAVQQALTRASGHFRHIIATEMELRYTPSLEFFYDETLMNAERLSRLLNQVDLNKSDE